MLRWVAVGVVFAWSCAAQATAPKVIIDTKMGSYLLQPNAKHRYLLDENNYQPSEHEVYKGGIHEMILTRVKANSIQHRFALQPGLSYNDDKLYAVPALNMNSAWEKIPFERRGGEVVVHVRAKDHAETMYAHGDERKLARYVDKNVLRKASLAIDGDDSLTPEAKQELRAQLTQCVKDAQWVCAMNRNQYEFRFEGEDGIMYHLSVIPAGC